MQDALTELEITPSSGPLADSVISVWARVTGSSFHATHPRVPPDGCADIIWIGKESPLVVGPTARCLIPHLRPCTLLSGVRIRPGAAASLLDYPAAELRDRLIPLESLWPAPLARQWAEVAANQTAPARLQLIQQLLTQRLSSAPPLDPLVCDAISLLEHDPRLRLELLSDRLGIGPRQLRRRFEFAVGYGPKTFQRIMRLQAWISMTDSGRLSLSTMALDAGYADQSHLTREVTRLMGISPSAFLADLSIPLTDISSERPEPDRI